MGYGEYSGNGSVHWSVVHEDSRGQVKKLRGKLKPNPSDPALPSPGSNEVNVDDAAEGHDDLRFGDIGVRQGHRGAFRIRLRFPTREAAVAAAEAAAKGIEQSGGGYFLVIDVPAINRETPKVNPPAEVRVQW